MSLSLEQGRDLVKYARSVIEGYFAGRKPEIPESLNVVFKEDSGVFVTLETYPKNQLRGCIGFPEPIMPLGNAVRQAALAAALEDPRFPPVGRGELEKIVVEVSVLSKPELVKVKDPRDYVKEVKIGRDGLIAEKGLYRGLLLPQVPVEWKWDAEEFLNETCMKAGLSPDAWLAPGTKMYKFSAQIFSEKTPRGGVFEKQL
ncbi:MAG: TIGR00296 family protein [Candidatus Altiarchaeales archaeon]|nr:TIGR00296 family protein [Candidatus Altiarchaeales archaeon]